MYVLKFLRSVVKNGSDNLAFQEYFLLRWNSLESDFQYCNQNFKRTNTAKEASNKGALIILVLCTNWMLKKIRSKTSAYYFFQFSAFVIVTRGTSRRLWWPSLDSEMFHPNDLIRNPQKKTGIWWKLIFYKVQILRLSSTSFVFVAMMEMQLVISK